ncbi:GH1 family beta-glucosidase [Sphingomonas crusticola]|uniref:GH1 family beta-glucosidase n=1 Tax=Sphingomonas crusticola TaxID=1697973 RepID=UPI000E2720CA|nr:GH1 family beta-glucosidase [Sphingomonas crusticola]
MKRRDLLKSGLALGSGLAMAGHSGIVQAAVGTAPVTFPKGFLWGVATAAYQVEGGARDGGRGPSIWDTFSHTPGKTKNGDTGDVADDSFHRWREDIALMTQLGVDSYRFSIAWSRIQPTGRGPANVQGLDYYKRLVDGLLEAGIRPFPTLYHWDLPQALEDAGGWPNRDTADRMTDYALIMAEALADRVTAWSVLNEVKTFTQAGYWDGGMAPGRKEPLAFLKATHVANIANANAFHALKAVNSKVQVGSAYDCANCFPATDSEADKAAAVRWDKLINLWYLQATLTGTYPELLPADRQAELLGWRAGDEARLKVPLDFVGINYYSGWRVWDEPKGNGIPNLNTRAEWAWSPRSIGKSDFGWDIDPPGIHQILKRMQQLTGSIPIEITENGIADNTPPGPDGRIHDVRRIAYLRAHLKELRRAIDDGVPVRAYHLWSLLDNFEWAAGYSQRFGIVHVDFEHGQKRSPRDSAYWYANVIKQNAVA